MSTTLSQTDRSLKLGVIGIGRWGRNIVRTIPGLGGVELRCVASNNPETRSLVPEGCEVFPDWKDLLAVRDLDGVIVATPPATHFDIATACIRAERPVLIEKPLTLELREAIALQEMAAAAHVLVMTEFTHLFNPKFQALQAALGLVGKIKLILTRAGNIGPYRPDVPVLWDWGAHDLSMLVALVGPLPSTIEAHRIEQGPGEQGEESNWVIACTFESGIRSKTVLGNMMPRCRTVAVVGSDGALVFDDFGERPLNFYPGWRQEAFPEGQGHEINIGNSASPLAQALNAFANEIRAGATSHWSLDLGIEVTRLLSRCSSTTRPATGV